ARFKETDMQEAGRKHPWVHCYQETLPSVNGEIYNHEELRAKLKSHQFRTGSDCEVIAHLLLLLPVLINPFYQYEEYGEDFVDMLDGMFSFVLLDTRDKSFIAARDAIGITPLYMGWGLDGMW
ncbi:hypothetical protein B296_00038869, partial [Ensete ventricosum]